MRPSSGRRMRRIVPLLFIGGVGLLLALPRGPASLNRIEPVEASSTPHTAALVKSIAPASQPILASTPAVAGTAMTDTVAAAVRPESQSNAPQLTQVALQLPSASTPAPAATTTAPDTAARTDGRIGSGDVNVRSGPSATSDKLFVIPAGEAVKLGETNGGWVHAYRQSGQDGWISRRLLAGAADTQTVAQAGPSAAPPRSTATARPTPKRLIGHFAQVRSSIAALEAPASGAPSAFVLEPGDRFRITQAHGSWLLVETDDGYSGWIPG
jgi:SH3-like domain-containing protein